MLPDRCPGNAQQTGQVLPGDGFSFKQGGDDLLWRGWEGEGGLKPRPGLRVSRPFQIITDQFNGAKLAAHGADFGLLRRIFLTVLPGLHRVQT